jgi:ubiquinone/menaquinone biosynthesis C-methylase UbiE
MDQLNPQREQMADESMVRTLAAQIDCIWPQERPLLARYGLTGALRILDAGCGTGEATRRLAEVYPAAQVLGVDILDHHLEAARRRDAALAPRVAYEHRSVFDLGLPDGAFDLTLCRHVIQSIPHADRVLAELARVTRRGGWLHLIAEDYDLLHFPTGDPDPRDFWFHVARGVTATGHGNLFIGRECVPLLERLGLTDLRLDYVVVDTLRVPRERFADIMVAWRDGYVPMSAQVTPYSEAEVRAYFDTMIAAIRDPARYACWHVPVVSGRVA